MLCLLLAYPARLCVLARRQGRSAQRVALAMSCVVLWFFMAMRAQTVGVDTKYYVCIYQQFPQISWKELFNAQLYPTPRRTWELDLEPGYRLLNKLLSIYLPAPQWITVANSALIIALLYRWLRRESPNAMLSIWLYLTLEYINCPRRRAATIQWLAVAAGLQYVLRLLINNIGGTMPYQFFWAA